MKTITLKRSRQLSSYYHGGQWSSLYQFASSGIILKDSDYLKELDFEIPNITVTQKNELLMLKRFFTKHKS